MKFYLDTSIWLDVYEDRVDRNGKPLGEYGSRILYKILQNEDEIYISDLLIIELKTQLSDEQINSMFAMFKKIIHHAPATAQQDAEAVRIGKERHLPKGDVLHAILARDHKLELITRDKHFLDLIDVSPHHKPEDLI